MVNNPKIDQAFKDLQADIEKLDFETFCVIAGINKTQAVVCMARAKKLSWQQILIKYGIPKATAQRVCKKCTQ